MKILENMNLCYGCGACANACRLNAISMEKASDGFLYPVIDEKKCVNCNACKSVCPALNAKFDNSNNPKVYAVMADDGIREKSASGGMFTLLADYAFSKNGYVCGAAFDEGFLSVSHIMIKNKKDLAPLRRSKYIPSYCGEIYKEVEAALKNDKHVLFTGTPCQCAALKSYLKKHYEKLILVDLICHGTASPKAWSAFLDEIGADKKPIDVNFRYKELIGWSATTHVKFEDGTEYTQRFKDDPFEQAASKNLISRKSCGTCQFARIPRQGDITIGDFWGIKKSLDDRKGTSAIMVNTEKGAQIIDELSKKGVFKAFEKIPFYKAFGKNNANVYKAPHTNPGRQLFFDKLNKGAKFSEAYNASKSQKYDVVLLSIWYAANYGSLMTNFALYKTLEDKGLNCIFAEIPDHLWPTSVNHRNPLFVTRRFAYKHFKLTHKYKDKTDLKKLNDISDCFIVGSDQIWNYSLCKSAGTYFFLDFVDEYKKKIAYGTSFGHDSFRGTEENKKKAGYYLRRFNAVSVREDYAVDICKNEFGVEACEVLDPVFMCDKRHYLECIKESNVAKNLPEQNYVLAYILDPTEEKQLAIENLSKRLNADIICLPNAHVDADMRKKWRLQTKENIEMEDWLWYFKNAKTVVTDSFHGTCFSIIFERSFVAIGNKRRGLARFESLLKNFGLENHLVYSAKDIIDNDSLLSDINYAEVNEKLEELRQNSRAWLDSALSIANKPPVFSTYDLVDKRIDGVVKTITENNATSGKEIEKLKVQLTAQKQELEKLSMELNKLIEAQGRKIQKTEQSHKHQITDMENSISWKITTPLRAVKRLFKKKK